MAGTTETRQTSTGGARTTNSNHYQHGEIECIDAIRSALTPAEFIGFCKGNAIKYLWRERYKGGSEDLDKAADYIEWAAGEVFKEEGMVDEQ